MKKVAVIFTAATGGGHNQAANALKQNLEAQNMTVHIVNLLNACPKFVEVLVEDGYSLMANHFPKLYGSLYHMSHDRHINANMKVLILKLMKARMKTCIEMHQPDLLISTHPFFVNPMAELKRKGETHAKCISVITDLGVHRFYLHPSIDAYITGSKHTSKQLQGFGIHADRIYDFGIPVQDKFYSKYVENNKSQAFKILLMGGSMGNLKLIKVLEALLKTDKPLSIDVVCGSNRKLHHYIGTHFQSIPSHITLNLHGFIQNVDRLMDHADLLISKPGGLTVTESLLKGLPMVIPFYIGGQEAENAEILTTLGTAINVKHPAHITTLLERMLQEPLILEKMRFHIQDVTSNYSRENTNNLIASLMAS